MKRGMVVVLSVTWPALRRLVGPIEPRVRLKACLTLSGTSYERRKMPAQGFGSKYVVLGGITSPRSASPVSASRAGGASVNSAPPSRSQRSVSSSSSRPAGAISTFGTASAPGTELADDRGRAGGRRRVPTLRRAGVPRKRGGEPRPSSRPRSGPSPGPAASRSRAPRTRATAAPAAGPVHRAHHPAVEGGQVQAVERVDRRTARRRPAAARPPATPRGWPRPGGGRRRCSGRPAELSGQGVGVGPVGHPPHGLLMTVGAGEVQHGRRPAGGGDDVGDRGPGRWSSATSAGRSGVVAKCRTSASTRSGRTDSCPRTRPSTNASVATSHTTPMCDSSPRRWR